MKRERTRFTTRRIPPSLKPRTCNVTATALEIDLSNPCRHQDSRALISSAKVYTHIFKSCAREDIHPTVNYKSIHSVHSILVSNFLSQRTMRFLRHVQQSNSGERNIKLTKCIRDIRPSEFNSASFTAH